MPEKKLFHIYDAETDLRLTSVPLNEEQIGVESQKILTEGFSTKPKEIKIKQVLLG